MRGNVLVYVELCLCVYNCMQYMRNSHVVYCRTDEVDWEWSIRLANAIFRVHFEFCVSKYCFRLCLCT